MLAVSVNKSYAPGMSEPSLLAAAAGAWSGLSDKVLAAHCADGTPLLFVARNVMVGAAAITGWERNSDGKVVFDLAPSPLSERVCGVAYPDPWVRGAARPARTLEPEALEEALAAAKVEQREPKERTVELDGIRLSVLGGVATVSVPAGRQITIAARR